MDMDRSTKIDNLQKVRDFHLAFGLDVRDTPFTSVYTDSPKLVTLRNMLIREEFEELKQAVGDSNMNETMDALMDILYVVYGTFVSYGLKPRWVSQEDYERVIDKYHEQFDEEDRVVLRTDNDTVVVKLEKMEVAVAGLEQSDVRLDTVQMYLNRILESCYILCRQQYFGRVVNADDCFGQVHRSNMSKLCASEEVAQRTVEWYLARPELGYDRPAYRYNDAQGLWVVYNSTTGKVLKSVEYHPVKFSFA
jgi:predicted HAD superfamily Cof-like phosphohydrolase